MIALGLRQFSCGLLGISAVPVVGFFQIGIEFFQLLGNSFGILSQSSEFGQILLELVNFIELTFQLLQLPIGRTVAIDRLSDRFQLITR